MRKRGRQLGRHERDILQELTLGDFLYSFLTSGRSLRAFHRTARERANYRYRRRLAIERLKDFEYVRQHGDKLTLLKAGRNALHEQVLKTRSKLATTRWDGKWRIVAFDIPEKYASLRRKVRGLLREAGFQKLQQSIWVFPHECEELSALIKERSGLSKFILYGTLETIENNAFLKTLFKVKA